MLLTAGLACAARSQPLQPDLSGVYVRDSVGAVEKLHLAERMERLGEWNKAADVYQEILAKYRDRVVAVESGGVAAARYTSIIDTVQQRLSRWPADAREVYRARFEGPASEVMASLRPDDLSGMHRLLGQYFVTNTAARAGMRLVAMEIERGEFASAAWVGDRLLRWHPGLGDDRALLLHRTAIAHRMAGDEVAFSNLKAELKRDFPARRARIGGVDVSLVEHLESLEQPPARGAERDSSWAMAFGNPSRSRVPTVENDGGAMMFSVEIRLPSTHGVRLQGMGREYEHQLRQLREIGALTGVFPVVDRGELYFTDNARVYALNLESGLPLPGWSATWDGVRQGRYTTSAPVVPRSLPCALAVTSDRVLAILGQPDLTLQSLTGAGGQRETRLVCLDRATGAELWVASPRSLGDAASPLRSLDLGGSPLVVGQMVYVQARGGKGNQFQDTYVLAFDLADGSLRWHTYISSASTGMMFEPDVAAQLGIPSHLAAWGGRLFVLSNFGSLASLDAHDGTVLWITLYPREQQDPQNRMNFARRARTAQQITAAKPWESNPVIVDRGRVFTLPADAGAVLVHDASDGSELRRIPMSGFDDARVLVGVSGPRLVVASGKQVFCIPWETFREDAPRQENLFWASSEFRRGQGQTGDSLRGRPFLTADSVYVPLAWGIARLSLIERDGALLSMYPSTGDWPELEGPGNVLVTPEHLVVAGPSRVNVYADLAVATAKLDRLIAESPRDPAPRLRYAEILFVAGQVGPALDRLDEAIALQDGAPDPAIRQRTYQTALSFSRKLSKSNDPRVLELASLTLDRAAGAAHTPSQQVEWKLARASLERVRNRPSDELEALQSILEDPELRSTVVVVEGGSLSAGMVVEGEISQLITRAGPGVYQPVAERSMVWLDDALRRGSADRLLDVAARFPNSPAASSALWAAAGVLERAGDHRRAGQALRQLYVGQAEHPPRATILQSMARNDLGSPGRVALAAARLAQASRLDRSARVTVPIRLPDGRVLEDVALPEAVALLRSFAHSRANEALPDWVLPPTMRAQAQAINRALAPLGAGRVSFLPRPFLELSGRVPQLRFSGILTDARRARADRLVAFSPGTGMVVLEPANPTPLWISPEWDQQPLGIHWVDDDIVAWTDARVSRVGSSGVRWSVTLADGADAPAALDPPAEPAAADEAAPRARRVRGPAARSDGTGILHVARTGDRVVVVTGTGAAWCLDLRTGEKLWSTPSLEVAVSHAIVVEDFIVLRIQSDLAISLLALDVSNGRTVFQKVFAFDGGGVPVNFALSQDGKLVWLQPDRIGGKDLNDPGQAVSFEVTSRIGDGSGPVFAGAGRPGQFLVLDDRIAVVSDQGSFVRLHSLEDGSLVQYGGVDALLATEASGANWNVSMLAHGGKLYAWGPRKVVAYDLERGEADFRTPAASLSSSVIRDVFLTRGHLVTVEQEGVQRPGARGGPPGVARLVIRTYNRQLVSGGRESGAGEYKFEIAEPSGVISMQAVNGGLYYVTGDLQMKFIRAGSALR
jgi:outer membrane protein assembly factor BamB